jgi:phage tail sheath protein FI
MPQYLTPGVYVEVVPPKAQPIGGASTTTAAFIGYAADIPQLSMPAKPASLTFSAGTVTVTTAGVVTQQDATAKWPALAPGGTLVVNGTSYTVDSRTSDTTLALKSTGNAFPNISNAAPFQLIYSDRYTQVAAKTPVLITDWPGFVRQFGDFQIATMTYSTGTVTVTNAGVVTLADGSAKWPTLAPGGTLVINGISYTVDSRTSDTALTLKSSTGSTFPTITTAVPFQLSYKPYQDNNYLAHAIYGFFANGGTRCYVARISSIGTDDLQAALGLLAANDEIAMVCAPLPPAINGAAVKDAQLQAVQSALLAHCELLQDRVAILDSLMSDDKGIAAPASQNGFGAMYFPWVSVSDPGKALGGRIDVPPSGHIAGVYARTDTNRGVYKAPANEQLLGVLNTTYALSDGIQAGLNPKNVNCIRVFSGAPTIWGARTVSLDPQFQYVNVRRFLIFLRKSILYGVRWAAFEPNSSGLWQRITRSTGDFLLTQWREGALIGDTPQDAFFVRCDKTTNTPDVQAQGIVVTEIGVKIVKPAEFVVFRIQQQTGS